MRNSNTNLYKEILNSCSSRLNEWESRIYSFNRWKALNKCPMYDEENAFVKYYS